MALQEGVSQNTGPHNDTLCFAFTGCQARGGRLGADTPQGRRNNERSEHCSVALFCIFHASPLAVSQATLGDVVVGHSLHTFPKPGRPERVVGLVTRFYEKSACTPSGASILRGKASYVGSQLQGRAIRFCERALTRRQHAETTQTAITKDLERTLQLLQMAPPRLSSKKVPWPVARPCQRSTRTPRTTQAARSPMRGWHSLRMVVCGLDVESFPRPRSLLCARVTRKYWQASSWPYCLPWQLAGES